jgi:hypothetical protein
MSLDFSIFYIIEPFTILKRLKHILETPIFYMFILIQKGIKWTDVSNGST